MRTRRSDLRIFGMAIVLGVVAWLQASASLAVPLDFVLAEGEASVLGSALNFQTNQFNTGDSAPPSVNGSTNASLLGSNASIDATAAMGSLSAITNVSNTNPTDFAYVVARGGSEWQDLFTVTSNTLPIGTPVNFLLTENLNVTMTSVGDTASSISSIVQYGTGESPAQLSTTFNNGDLGNTILNVCSGFCSASSNAMFSALVGSTFILTGSLGISSIAYGQNGGDFFVGGSATVDAAHTATAFLDSLTSGASYTTASGITYFTPTPTANVPEPSTILLLGSALVGLVAWRWKPAR